jgi:hypothetical protein
MRNVLKVLSLLLVATWLAGCAKDHEELTTVAHKQPRRYFRPPLDSGMAQYPSFRKGLFPEGSRAIDEVLFNYGPYALNQLKPYFKKAGVAYPPRDIVLLAIKNEKKMELWARDQGQYRLIRPYGIKAASGMRGPKLEQGDRQVPEGIYHISRLNPNSNYHLSMKVDYPNNFDLEHAEYDGRSNLGGDIFIHGKAVSAGCLAMGDAAIEELFVLAAHVGTENIKVIIAPSDPRKEPLDLSHPSLPSWTPELYAEITRQVMTVTGSKPPRVRLARNMPTRPVNRAMP